MHCSERGGRTCEGMNTSRSEEEEEEEEEEEAGGHEGHTEAVHTQGAQAAHGEHVGQSDDGKDEAEHDGHSGHLSNTIQQNTVLFFSSLPLSVFFLSLTPLFLPLSLSLSLS